MKKFMLLAFLIQALNANCQKVFLDENYNQVKDSLKARYIKVTLLEEKPVIRETYLSITGEKLHGRIYNKRKGEVLTNYTWHKNGNLKSEINYSEGQLNGPYLIYWENGQLKREDHYQMGKYEKGICYDNLGNKIEHYDYEIQPEYTGGANQLMRDIQDNLRYPPNAIYAKIQGRVIVGMVIKEDGTITNISVLKGIDKDLDNEAMRVVQGLKKFKPGLRDGEPASFDYTVPITFRLQ